MNSSMDSGVRSSWLNFGQRTFTRRCTITSMFSIAPSVQLASPGETEMVYFRTSLSGDGRQ
jgi:hypothetical protein